EQSKLSELQDQEYQLRNAEDRAASEAQSVGTREKIKELSGQTAEAEQRLADIHTGTQDWERIQELYDVASFFLSKSAGRPEATVASLYSGKSVGPPGSTGKERTSGRSGRFLPTGVVPISRLAGKNWELVFKDAKEETFEEFPNSFVQVIPRSRVV